MTAFSSETSLYRPAGSALWPFHVGATADVVVGAGLAVFASPAALLIMPGHAEVLGIPASAILRGLGTFLVLFALETVLVAREGVLSRYRSWVVAANWATVALAVALLAAANFAFSAIGLAAIAMIGVFVAAITLLQQRVL
jgi:hypothetical protein